MRVLVAGSLPPPESARAAALRSEVARLLAEGHTVEVVAPDPVATAHRYLSPAGLAGCVRLASMVSSFDSVVVQVEPGLPVRARAGRVERALSLLAFSLVVRRGRDVVIRLDRLNDLPGGPSGRAALRVWRNAERIVVGSEDQRVAFVTAVGSQQQRCVVSSARPRDAEGEDGGWGEGSDASAENVLELVRVRAARERRELAASPSAHVAGWDRLPTPGIATIDSGTDSPPSAVQSRGLAHLARSALAAADRRPLLGPAAAAARAARRNVLALFRPEPPD